MKFQYLSYLFTSLALIVILGSCTKLPEDCSNFENWEIISEKEKEEACDYQQIYLLEGEYYSICECCTCDKNPIVLDCNGEVFCDFKDGCLPDFYASAEYQYSAVEKD